MAELKTISHTHDMVMNWMLENPHRNLQDCAAYFGYTPTWLSSMIHSDAFQAKLKEKQGAVFSMIAEDIPARMRGLAHLAIDKMEKKLESTNDGEFIQDAFTKILDRAGYAPKSGNSAPQQQNNVFVVDAGTLSAARASMAPRPVATVEQSAEEIPQEIAQEVKG